MRTSLVPDVFTKIASCVAFFPSIFLGERVSTVVNSGAGLCAPARQSFREKRLQLIKGGPHSPVLTAVTKEESTPRGPGLPFK